MSEPRERDIAWLFIGKSGIIRAGWGILLFVLVLAVTQIAAGFFVGGWLPYITSSTVLTPRDGIIMEAFSVFVVLVATAVLGVIEHKQLLAYGYKGQARAVRFFWGIAWGFIALTVLVFSLHAAGLLAFDPGSLHGSIALRYGVEWGCVFLLTGIFEESLMRGYVQFTMTRGVGFWYGALLFSFLFGFIHSANPGESPVGLVSAGLIGLVFCLSLWYTGSLWWAVGFHAAWDWGESYFYGAPDSGLIIQGHLFSAHPVGKLLWSGGKTGPEGSLLILPLLGLIALVMWLWWRRRVQSPFADSAWRPAWSRKSKPSSGEPMQEAA